MNVRSLLLVSTLSIAACNRGPDPASGEPTPTNEGSAEAPAEAPQDGSAEAAPAAAEEGSADAAEVEAEPVDPQAALREAIAGHGPIEGDVYDLIWAEFQDDIPETLNATREDLEGRHYLTCDEVNLHIWYEHVRDIGGAYAGVGSDQAYTFIGWMRPQVAWLTDYDPWVRTTHKIYRVAFENGANIQEFRDFWADENLTASWALLEAAWSDDEDFRFMSRVWGDWGPRIERRLRRYRRILSDAGIPSFLTDEETYTFVRDFVLSGRTRPLLANLLDDTALSTIGDVSRELDVPIRVFYLSNAEDYWDYPDQFRQNFQNLHFDENSLILRTNASKRRNGDYRYCMQPALNFQQWLQQDYVDSVDDIWIQPRIENEDHIPLTIMDDEPFDRER
jgi:hypothetical protein